MSRLFLQPLPIAVALLLGTFTPVAMAHDMENVAIAYVLLLAIPVPALFALAGWWRAMLYAIPISVSALWLANSGHYGLMYGVLFSPYVLWIGRAVLRHSAEGKRDV